ncbi:uncharacterized protein LOC123315311 [Coccinella septempunctata]|uniref:uncharacterized protein LOC123315311 n=1 Tax=Coccinella septempunctata TaxID=41139 RepID=UPI001D06ADA2|nr:uncharacterized protein LOC123315311 [Coccinella septempunctata]
MSFYVRCNEVGSRRSPSIICSFCRNHYHANGTCSDVTKNQLSAIKNMPGTDWKCDTCRQVNAHVSSGGDRKRQSTSAGRPSLDGQSQRVEKPIVSDDESDTEGRNGDVSQPIQSLTLEIRNLRESVNFCSGKISDFEIKLGRFNELVTKLGKLERENELLKKQVTDLNSEVNNLEQFSRSNNIEIQNIPEKPNENIMEIISSIGRAIDQPVDSSCIDFCSRVPTNIQGRPKNIVLRFISKIRRDDFLDAYKVKRVSNSGSDGSGIRVENVSERLYINEHLSIHNKKLFKEARDIAKNKEYKYVWTQSGNILLRKNDASKILHIRSSEDLRKL